MMRSATKRKHLSIIAVALPALMVALLIAGCGATETPATPTPVPPPPTLAPLPTFTPPPMADKLILFGDLAKFGERGAPDTCTLKNRFKRGESVGFRMTAIDPMTGKYVETAELVVHVTYGGKTTDIPMRYRGTGTNPRPGFWTGKWVVPDDAPAGIVEYSVTAKDDKGRTGEFKPFQVEPSELAVVD